MKDSSNHPGGSTHAGGLRRRLLRSHLIVAGIGLGMLALMLLATLELRTNARRLAELRGPTVRASTLALEGVQRSIAGLRGWMALNSAEFKQERSDAWKDSIEPALARLDQLSAGWTEPRNHERLQKAEKHLHKLKQAQWWIEDVAQTPGNEPARVRLNQEADPVAEDMLNAVTTMIDIERALAGDADRCG